MIRALIIILFLVLLPSPVLADPISFVISIISAAITTGGFATGITLFGISLGVFATTALIVGSSLLMGGLQKALAPKPKSLSSGFRGQTVTVREPIFTRRFLYGEARIGGFIIFFEETNDKKDLHVVIGFCEGEIEGIETVYLGDVPVFSDMLNGAGLVTEGKFKNKVRIIKHLGSTTQAADAALVSEVGKWTTARPLKGIAYVYIRFKFDQDLFPRGMPNISADIKGRKVLDTRTGMTIWTPNPALCINDYMKDTKFGPGFAVARIDTTFVNSAANICDEIVDTLPVALEITNVDPATDLLELSKTGTSNPRILPLETGDRGQMTTTGTLPGGIAAATNFFVIINHPSDVAAGIDKEIQLASSYDNALAGTSINITSAGSGTHTFTKNAEPRYTMHGFVESDMEPGEIIEDMLASMIGSLVPSGGVWLLFAGAFQTSTVSFNEDILRGSVQTVTKHSGRDRFNAVKGIFASRLSEGQPTDFPVVTNSVFETEDGGRRVFQDLQLQFTNRPQTAQRIAKVALAVHRQEISVMIKCKLEAFEIRANDTVQFTYEKAGWVNKDFRVVEWRLVAEADSEGIPYFGVDLSLRETDPTVYDFDETTEETVFDPAPDMNLPSSLSIAAPTGLTITSGTPVLFLKSDGTVVSRIKAAWTESVDAFVDCYEVQFKKSADVTFVQATVTKHPTVEAFIWEVEDGVDYDVRVRAINSIGVRSDTADIWAQTVLNHTVIGKTELPSDVITFTIEGKVLTWTHSFADLDLAGFVIRYHQGVNRSFGDAIELHTGTLPGSRYTLDVVPAGQVTFLIKAIDTSGNFSLSPAIIIINLGDALVANVVETFDFKALGWPGTLTNGTIDGSNNIIADDTGDLMWDTNDTRDMWTFDVVLFYTGSFKKMIYEDSFSVSKAAAGSILTIPFTAQGNAIAIDYRRQSPDLMWSSQSGELMWASNDTVLLWTISPFEPWPGSVVAENDIYDVRITTGFGVPQGQVSAFAVVIDVPDVIERINDLTLAAGGTRISLTKTFTTTIKNINVTLQDDGGAAESVRVIDKNLTLGPLIQAFDGALAGTPAKIDATIQGF